MTGHIFLLVNTVRTSVAGAQLAGSRQPQLPSLQPLPRCFSGCSCKAARLRPKRKPAEPPPSLNSQARLTTRGAEPVWWPSGPPEP